MHEEGSVDFKIFLLCETFVSFVPSWLNSFSRETASCSEQKPFFAQDETKAFERLSDFIGALNLIVKWLRV
jgi:hypothetical protein